MIDEARGQMRLLLTFLLLLDGPEELLVYFVSLPEHACGVEVLTRAVVGRGLGWLSREGEDASHGCGGIRLTTSAIKHSDLIFSLCPLLLGDVRRTTIQLTLGKEHQENVHVCGKLESGQRLI